MEIDNFNFCVVLADQDIATDTLQAPHTGANSKLIIKCQSPTEDLEKYEFYLKQPC